MKNISILVLVSILAAGLGLMVACGGDDDGGRHCNYDDASATCQQAYDCCIQLATWADEEGYAGYDLSGCEPYTCVETPDSTCQSWLAQAVMVEDTYDVDFADCN